MVVVVSFMMSGCAQLSKLFVVTPPPDQQIDRRQQATVARLKSIVEPELRDNLTVTLPPCERAWPINPIKWRSSSETSSGGTLADPG